MAQCRIVACPFREIHIRLFGLPDRMWQTTLAAYYSGFYDAGSWEKDQSLLTHVPSIRTLRPYHKV